MNSVADRLSTILKRSFDTRDRNDHQYFLSFGRGRNSSAFDHDRKVLEEVEVRSEIIELRRKNRLYTTKSSGDESQKAYDNQ
jgi:hypothetical protein